MRLNTIRNTDSKYININTDHGYLKQEKEQYCSTCQEPMTSYCMEELLKNPWKESLNYQYLEILIVNGTSIWLSMHAIQRNLKVDMGFMESTSTTKYFTFLGAKYTTNSCRNEHVWTKSLYMTHTKMKSMCNTLIMCQKSFWSQGNIFLAFCCMILTTVMEESTLRASL